MARWAPSLALLGLLLALGAAAAAAGPNGTVTLSNTTFVRVRLVFQGMSQDSFDGNPWVQNGTQAAIAKSGGVPTDYVLRVTGSEPAAANASASSSSSSSSGSSGSGSGSGGGGGGSSSGQSTSPKSNRRLSKRAAAAAAAGADGRRLLATPTDPENPAGPQAVARYKIRTGDVEWAAADTIRRKLMASAANFGESFYANLDAAGVQQRPAVYVDDQLMLFGIQPAWDTPTSRNASSTSRIPPAHYFEPSDLRPPNATLNVTDEGAKTVPPPAEEDMPQGPPMVGALPLWAFATIVAIGGAVLLACLGVCAWKVWRTHQGGMRRSGSGANEQFIMHDAA